MVVRPSRECGPLLACRVCSRVARSVPQNNWPVFQVGPAPSDRPDALRVR
jgi:hypothetical protein